MFKLFIGIALLKVFWLCIIWCLSPTGGVPGNVPVLQPVQNTPKTMQKSPTNMLFSRAIV